MKKTKGIGPNNLGVSKAAVKNAYGDTAMTKKMGSAYGDSMVNNNKFAKAVQDARAAGDKTFEVNGETYNLTSK